MLRLHSSLTKQLSCLTAAVAVAAIAGCQDSDFNHAQVSGIVTLDGEPLPRARVFFSPKRQGEGIRAGMASTGLTDDAGRFTLKTSDGQAGAVVATHRVKISTYAEREVEGSDDSVVAAPELVPAKYNNATILSCEVPAEGLKDHRFDLTTN